MSEKIPYEQVMGRMRMDIDYIAEEAYQKGKHDAEQDLARAAYEEAYQKGFEAGQHEATTLEYQQGLDDAWEAIREIARTTYAQRSEIFDGLQYILSIMRKFSPSEVTAKIREYEQQKADEIKVGDEVIPIDVIRRPFVVVSIENNAIKGFDLTDGYTPRGCHRDETHWEKTGRHFPHVEELVKAMKGGAE